MAQIRSQQTVRLVARDLRRDWGAWSPGERFTASLACVGILYLVLVVFAPRAGTLPW